jgi:hypothetical protein
LVGGEDDTNWQNSMRANDLTAIPIISPHVGLPIAIALLSVLAIRSGKPSFEGIRHALDRRAHHTSDWHWMA